MKNKFKVGDLVTGVQEKQFLVDYVARVVKVGDKFFGEDAYVLEYVGCLCNDDKYIAHSKMFEDTVWYASEMKLFKDNSTNEVGAQLSKSIVVGDIAIVEFDNIGLVGGEVVCLLDSLNGKKIGVDFRYIPPHISDDLSDLAGILKHKSGRWVSKDEIKTVTPHKLIVGDSVKLPFGREGVITSMGWSPETKTFNTTITFDGENIVEYRELGMKGNDNGFTYTFKECEDILTPIKDVGNECGDMSERCKKEPKFKQGDMVIPKTKLGKQLSGSVYDDMEILDLPFLYINNIAEKKVSTTLGVDENIVVYEVATSYKSLEGGDFYSECDLELYTEDNHEFTSEVLGFENLVTTFDFKGATIVCTIHKDGKKFKGTSMCLPYDVYDRDLGKRIATHRAIHKMNEHGLNELLD